jgi:hypothetical protein
MSTKPTAAQLARQVDAWTGPMSEEVRFLKVRNGQVHVQAFDPDGAEGEPVTSEALTDLLVGAVWTRCGIELRKNRGGLEHAAWPTLRFPDAELCQRCVRSVPGAEQWRLFEHPQGAEAE